MEYKFKLPIGDWSSDGHGKHYDFIISSNKPLNKVRELYFKACEEIGFSLDGSYKNEGMAPNSEYGDYRPNFEILKILIEFGVKIEKDDLEYIHRYNVMPKHIFCNIILSFIMTQDPNLVLKRIESEKIEMFQFYGFDEKRRHIGYFGYGLFVD